MKRRAISKGFFASATSNLSQTHRKSTLWHHLISLPPGTVLLLALARWFTDCKVNILSSYFCTRTNKLLRYLAFAYFGGWMRHDKRNLRFIFNRQCLTCLDFEFTNFNTKRESNSSRTRSLSLNSTRQVKLTAR